MLVQLHISWQITHFLNSLITHRFCIKKQRTKSEFPRYQSYYDLNWFEKRHFKTRKVFTIAHSNTFHHQFIRIFTLRLFLCRLFLISLYVPTYSHIYQWNVCVTPSSFILEKNMHLFQLRQFATNSLRNKNNSSVTFAPNQTNRTGVSAIER